MLGRDPVLWGKSMVSMFRSMASPKYAFEWGAREDVQAVAREMMKFGGSPLQTSEYFTSLPEITKTLGKIPKAGKAADWAVEQTFGRTGLGFTFFSRR